MKDFTLVARDQLAVEHGVHLDADARLDRSLNARKHRVSSVLEKSMRIDVRSDLDHNAGEHALLKHRLHFGLREPGRRNGSRVREALSQLIAQSLESRDSVDARVRPTDNDSRSLRAALSSQRAQTIVAPFLPRRVSLRRAHSRSVFDQLSIGHYRALARLIVYIKCISNTMSRWSLHRFFWFGCSSLFRVNCLHFHSRTCAYVITLES